MRRSRTLQELSARFNEKVSVVDDPGSCWEWTGTVSKGYGTFWVPRWLHPEGERSRMHTAHRVSYWLATGTWPGERGNDVCHRCDNPLCVRPSHLWLGTHHENMLDAKAKGRMYLGGAPAGELNPLHKLSDNDIREIARRALAGEVQTIIATEYGISQSVVSRVKTGKYRATATGQPMSNVTH